MLEFDVETHSYTLHGRPVPGVTQVVNDVLPGFEAGAYYLSRGTALHRACELYDAGKLDFSSVDPSIEARLHAWIKFRVEYPARIVAREKRLAHDLFLYAGTLDAVLHSERDGTVLADLKSTLDNRVRVQLGGYSAAWHRMSDSRTPHARIDRAVAVELNDDGTYRCLWLTRQELLRAEQTFLACLTVFNFCREHGIKAKGRDQ